MSYSRSISREKIGKRILISWAIVAVIFAAIGGAVGWYFGANNAPTISDPLQKQNEPVKERMQPQMILPKVINL